MARVVSRRGGCVVKMLLVVWCVMKILYTDGACSGNPGPGGWGVVIVQDGKVEELSGGELDTTNNRMEMRAVIEAMRTLRKGESVELWTDSQYVQKGVTEWVSGWKKRGWRTAGGQAVKNKDLWQEILHIAEGLNVRWLWLKGHAGHQWNEKADSLARAAIDAIKKGQ